MDYIELDQLQLHPDRVHVNALEPIVNSIKKFGFNGVVRVWRGYIIGGSHSYLALVTLRERGEPLPKGQGVRANAEGHWEVATLNTSHLTQEAALAFMLADNNLGRAGHDDPQALQKLLAELSTDLINAAGYGALDLADMIGELEESEDASDLLPDVEPVVKPGFVPATYWPSTNEWGVPDLLPELQGERTLPGQVVKWGSVARTSLLEGGLFHFYTEDYKMHALLDDPTPVVNTRCKAVIEPNISTRPDMPRAEVLYWAIYKKRWLARYWQSQGIRIYVDMNVEREYFDLALLGVPKTWSAFANRSYVNDLSHLSDAYNLIVRYVDNCDTLIYVVYGGGVDTARLCKERHWIWIPEEADVVRGRYQEEAHGTGYGTETAKTW